MTGCHATNRWPRCWMQLRAIHHNNKYTSLPFAPLSAARLLPRPVGRAWTVMSAWRGSCSGRWTRRPDKPQVGIAGKGPVIISTQKAYDLTLSTSFVHPSPNPFFKLRDPN